VVEAEDGGVHGLILDVAPLDEWLDLVMLRSSLQKHSRKYSHYTVQA
jgi:hypothetical protein